MTQLAPPPPPPPAGPPPPPPAGPLHRPPVDPRFRRRWAEARREEGRRRLHVLLGAIVACLVVGAGVALVHTPLFKVRDVTVSGSPHTPRSQVLAAAGLAPGDGTVLMVDAGSPRDVRAVEALPWVATVSFQRHWPWTLGIVVTERRPVGLVRLGTPATAGTGSSAGGSSTGGSSTDGGEVAVVDRSGRVLEDLRATTAGTGAPQLPVLVGLRPAAPGELVSPAAGNGQGAVADLLQAAVAVPPALARRGVTLSVRRGIGLVATVGSTGALVVLGDALGLPAKMAVLGELLDRVDLANYSQVDLTVPQRPALTPLSSGGSS